MDRFRGLYNAIVNGYKKQSNEPGYGSIYEMDTKISLKDIPFPRRRTTGSKWLNHWLSLTKRNI